MTRRYLILVLALLPLLLSFFRPAEEDTKTRIVKTIEASPPEVTEKVEKAIDAGDKSYEDLIVFLPGRKLPGALLPRDTWAHWGLAALSAATAGLGIVLIFGVEKKRLRELAAVGAFTGTVGIALLLLVQVAAQSSQGMGFHFGGRGAILLLFVKFIGFSYSAALDPSNGFGASFFGFTCGVGFCEELCKALPLVWHFRNKATLDWRGAMIWGLASGIGFGVSEGITYSSDYYNGVSGVDMYVVRFVSCVALHAFWAAAAGIVLYERQQTIQGPLSWYEFLPPLAPILGVPMVLHGLYDTLLKRDMGIIAFVVAAASFGWFAFQIERVRRLEKY
jgi:hypothetical protein